ncbi:glycosylphosphatidylinositol anchor biosynthesis [Endocarpon pusillum]|uniref:Glycosylphosphatidylinositol anchor biosynthesis n=1 Tax=Endocarpon pusillum TaxID=364733 RepID=A0A8H7AJC4_9EURO|nr:glycosylphosphatidylinositol anchor biosynthesis [Endocarpon pusillum]
MLLSLVVLAVGAASTLATHTSNWAVLVSTSRFWFNYRHLSNTLSLYRTVKRLGIPDSQILLLLPDDMACNPRNAFPGTVYSNADRRMDLYGENVEVDYRGYEVTVENFIRLLTDRWDEGVPAGKRLGTDEGSNILIYMTGHGGSEFLKFQDSEEISSWDLADAFSQMREKKRYNEMLFMIDTCQANTLYRQFYASGMIATGSSEEDESSYSHHADNDVGVAVIDRWTYYVLDFLETQVTGPTSEKTLGDLFDSYDIRKIHSNPGVRWDLFPGGEAAGRSRRVVDFFGNVQSVEVQGNRTKTELWREDIAGLRGLIAEYEERAEHQERNQTKTYTVTAAVGAKISTCENSQTSRVKAMNIRDEIDWRKQVGGITVIGGLAAIWFLGPMFLS